MEEVENFELEQEVDGLEPEVSDEEVDKIMAELESEYEPVPEAQDELPLGMENDEEPVNSIETMVNSIERGDLNDAEGSFKDIINDRLSTALDAKKVELANSVYNGFDAPDGAMGLDIPLDDESTEIEGDIDTEQV